ncbi:ester cyclase [Corynebacterium sp. S7]
MANQAMPAAQKVFAAINSGDLTSIPDCVTDDFVDHAAPFSIPAGPEGYTKILTFVTQVLKIRYDIEDTIETDDRLVFRTVAHGEGVPQVYGPKAEGKHYDMPTIHIYRTSGDRLAEHWATRDEVGAMVQMGALPPRETPANFGEEG